MDGDSVRARAFQLRERGSTYSLIEKTLGISYREARQLGKAYDAAHGRPRAIVRRLASVDPNSGSTTIPVRELRNNGSRILRQVEQGRRFVITVSGNKVAALVPLESRSAFLPRARIEAILREAPLDEGFNRDLRRALSQRVDEL
jgi:prevent-host-death family protein